MTNNKIAAFLAKICSIENRIIKFDIWDTAGQERFRSLAPMYYRNAAAAIIVFDVTNYVSNVTGLNHHSLTVIPPPPFFLFQNSFTGAKRWVDELPLDVMIALVGNKIDLEQDRQVLVDEIKEYVAEKDLIYIETSARLGININHVFNEIGNNPSPHHLPTHFIFTAKNVPLKTTKTQTVNIKESHQHHYCAC